MMQFPSEFEFGRDSMARDQAPARPCWDPQNGGLGPGRELALQYDSIIRMLSIFRARHVVNP